MTQSDSQKSNENLTHSTVRKEQRKKEHKEGKSKAGQEARQKPFDDEYQKMRQNGIFMCKHIDAKTRCRCNSSFYTQASLDKHVEHAMHMYPSQNMSDIVACTASAPGGIVAMGSRSNRMAEYGDTEVHKGSGPEKSGTDYYQLGCYHKPSRATNGHHSDEVKRDLKSFFLRGEEATGEKRGKQKYTVVEEARAELERMTDKTGMKKYSSTSIHGPLLSESQIRSVFAGLKKKFASVGINNMSDECEGLD